MPPKKPNILRRIYLAGKHGTLRYLSDRIYQVNKAGTWIRRDDLLQH